MSEKNHNEMSYCLVVAECLLDVSRIVSM